MPPPLAAAAVAGHFGELIQGRLGPEGPVVLVTLPAPPLRVTARLLRGPFGLHCLGGQRLLLWKQAGALCRSITGAAPRGRLLLWAGMPAGGGAGSSSAALLAAAAVYARANGRATPSPDQLARLCLKLEGATDPLMYPNPGRLLWAPREARVVTLLPDLPDLEVVGGFFGSGLRTDPADVDFADISDLVAAWPSPAARGDLSSLAALATESARRNHARRGGAPLEPLAGVGRRCGALGLVAAHTGSARGLIFGPGVGRPALAVEALRAIGLRSIRRFRLRPGARAD